MERGQARLQLRLAADAVSVPGARRFAVDGLTGWGEQAYAEAVELVVSELTSNAALHSGASYMYLTLERRPSSSGVRVSVEDDGPVGADVVHASARTSLGPLHWAEQATTGRGLALVAMLSHEWGVDDTSLGKRVWASLSDPLGTYPVRPPLRSSGHSAAALRDELPPDWALVRLAQCPVELSLQQDRHLDELVRELQLLGVRRGDRASARIAQEIKDLLVSPAHARLAGRRAAEGARERGLEAVDIEMAMPRAAEAGIIALNQAVARADALCEQDRLLALASPPAVRELRDWMTHEIVAQATRGSTPVPWPDWLAGRPARAHGD